MQGVKSSLFPQRSKKKEITLTDINDRHPLARELLLCGTDSVVGVSLNTFILTSLHQKVIYPLYPYNLHFSDTFSSTILRTSIINI